MTASKLIFGITGGSGSGKSYISGIFAELGISVFDADKIGHEVTAPGGAAYAELAAHFGSGYFAPDGTLLRRKLAALVFSDENELRILNEITHKHIREELQRRIADCKTQAAAIDGAVIIGSNVGELCAFMVGVSAPREVRRQRIIVRDGITEQEADARIGAQANEEFYRIHCKYMIENSGKNAQTLLDEAKAILYRELDLHNAERRRI